MNNTLRCSQCGAVIAAWEDTFRWTDAQWVCGDCFDSLVDGLDRMELAGLMGCEIAMGEEL